MADTIDAVWTGPFVGQLSTPRGMLEVIPGKTEAQVSEADLVSTHWTRKTVRKAKPTAEAGEN